MYERHRPEQTPLYGLIEKHFPRLLERLDAEGVSLPHFFVETPSTINHARWSSGSQSRNAGESG